MKEFKIKKRKRSCTLEKCPVGLFISKNDVFALKTEYGLEAYIVSSGERFWGGVNNLEDLKNVRVYPCEVEAQPQVNVWIPCKERMPKKPLFSWDGYIVQKNNVEEPFSAYWDGEKWMDDEDNEIEGIIAWQPLPTPYEEKEND